MSAVVDFHSLIRHFKHNVSVRIAPWIRCMPDLGMLAKPWQTHEGFCEDLARQNTVAYLSQLQLGFRRCRMWVTYCRIWVSVIVVVS
jgi:hypothetical protein